MSKLLATTLALALVVAICGLAADVRIAQAQSTGTARAPTPAEVSAARVAAMKLSGATRAMMKALVDKGLEPKTLAYPADGLVGWAKALPSMFPAGTGPESIQTEAKGEIWTDRAGFLKAAEDYVAATQKLSDFAHANDADNFKAQLAVVGNACNACHTTYRAGATMNFSK
jgi:cytochrome c556